MYPLLRPLLFKTDPEKIHHLTLRLVRLGGAWPFRLLLQALYATPARPVQVFGLNFRNPVGLAAGYDKDGCAWQGLAGLGFGHIEIGTVTLLPQPGNPRPRIFRLPGDQALINRMGFPGLGSEFVAAGLKKRPPAPREGDPARVVLGVNLGKNKDTPLEESARDYTALVRTFTPLADYLAINVSSPNTLGLRRLQGRHLLENLLGAIAQERQELCDLGNRRLPILVKLAPDLAEDELEDALAAVLDTGMDGIIATNTTLGRDGLVSEMRNETGGLSGAPLREKSEAILRLLVGKLNGRLPVVSAGGIMSPQDAKIRLDAGASLVQVYTGLVYAGPGLVRQINLAL